jgi:hypothetical protein
LADVIQALTQRERLSPKIAGMKAHREDGKATAS